MVRVAAQECRALTRALLRHFHQADGAVVLRHPAREAVLWRQGGTATAGREEYGVRHMVARQTRCTYDIFVLDTRCMFV